jgi:hypothetical protein
MAPNPDATRALQELPKQSGIEAAPNDPVFSTYSVLRFIRGILIIFADEAAIGGMIAFGGKDDSHQTQ